MVHPYGTNEAEATKIAADLTAMLVGKHARLTPNGHDKTVTAYRVERYTGTLLFGIVERWKYDGLANPSELGGGFIDLPQARTIINRG